MDPLMIAGRPAALALAVALAGAMPVWLPPPAGAVERAGEADTTRAPGAPPGEARAPEEGEPKAYFTLGVGADLLTTNTSGDVIDRRLIAQAEFGLGWRVRPSLLLEGTFGWLEGQRQQTDAEAVTPGEEPGDTETTYYVTANPIMVRARYLASPSRKRAFHPEVTVGVGFYSVNRWHRTYAFYPIPHTNQLLPAAELGLGAAYDIFDRWEVFAHTHFTATRRRGIVDETDHLSGFTFFLGTRVYPVTE
jgi:hypothetical protein